MKKIIISMLFIINLFGVNILILNSYSPTIKWTAVQTHTLIDQLKEHIKALNLYVEYMNTKQFRPNEIRDKNYLTYLNNKYGTLQFDIIIVTDDNALNFVRKYKNQHLLKKAKVFFEGINNLSLNNKLNKNIYAGVFEKKDPLSNLEIAKKINPNLKTIYVISDASTSGNKTIKQYHKAFENIKGINFVYINNPNLDEVLKKLHNYDINSVMMLLTFGSMKYNNNVVDLMEVPVIISKQYNNPILVHNDIYKNIPNTNIVGGDCTDAIQQAMLNSKKVLQYLDGTPMKNIGFILNGANKIYLNVKNLRRFGVDADDLDIKDAVLINKPTSFYDIYKNEIITFFIIVILVISFLIVLAKKNRDLYKYSEEIKKLNKNLQEKIKKAIEENRKQEQLLFQQSKLAAMGEMIGAIAHQWRQPLNSLGLNIQLLVDDFLDKKVDEEYILNFEKKQLSIINFMSHTIDDFRNFFSKDKEKIYFLLKNPIRDVLKILEKQLNSFNIKIDCNSDDSEILGYENEFKQVILNIINNAKDAIVHNEIKNPEISIEIKDKIITITDNAGGIPKEVQDRIFEPYFTTKDEGKGTGIGLYMSKIIIEEHMNGKLYFEVNDNKTKFIIDLKGTK